MFAKRRAFRSGITSRNRQTNALVAAGIIASTVEYNFPTVYNHTEDDEVTAEPLLSANNVSWAESVTALA